MAVDDPLLGHGRQVIVREEWLRLTEEPILEPGLPIIDPHHHLWQRAQGSYLLPELLADTGSGHDIRGTIFVQCGEMYRAGGPAEEQSLGETEFVTGIAADQRQRPPRQDARLRRHHRHGRPDAWATRSIRCSTRTRPSPARASAASATAPPGIPRRR